MTTSDALIESFHEQVRWCDKLGSDFTARLLEALAQDWLAGGPMRTAASACCTCKAPASASLYTATVR